MLSWYLLQLEIQKQNSDYKQRSNQILATIQQGLQNDNDVLLNMRFFIDVVGNPAFDGFIKFVTPYFILRPEIESVAYAPVVKNEERKDFETKARVLFPDYSIHGTNKADDQNMDSYPIYLQQPDDPLLLGLDIGSRTSVLKAIHEAQDTNSIVTLDNSIPDTFGLEQDQSSPSSTKVELFYPIYRKGASFSDPNEWRTSLIGVTALRLNLRTLITSSTPEKTAQDMQMLFNDRVNDSSTQDETKNSSLNDKLLTSLDLKQEFTFELPIKVGNKQKNLVFIYRNQTNWLSKHSTVVMVFGVTLSVLFLFIINILNQAKLARAKEIAESATQAKTDFLANMSHEIRTPMNGIMAMISFTLDSPLSSQQREWLNIAHSSAESLLGIINDILDLSKIQADKMTLESTSYNMNDLILSITNLLYFRANEKDIKLLAYIDPKLPTTLVGDPLRLRQIITNLVGNALKFTESGHVIIRLRKKVIEKVDHLFFEIEDTGIGIAQDKIEAIFEKFNQENTSTTRRFGGTGLGLTISKKLVEMMHGTIGAHSKQGEGTTFWFCVPLSEGETNSVPKDFSAIKNSRTLIIEPYDVAKNLLVTYFASWNMKCDTIDATKQNLAAIGPQLSKYQFILIDTEYEGWKMIMELRSAMPSTTPKPSLVLLAPPGTVLEGNDRENSGIFGLVTKPILPTLLIEKMLEADQAAHSKTRAAENPQTNSLQEVNLAHTQPASVQFSGVKILLVEDNLVNQKLMKIILSNVGCIVDLAGNGVEAIAKAKSSSYDIILMDCQMPTMDGFQATQAIRADSDSLGNKTPIIAITAEAMQGDRDRCIDAGMDDYITKPVKPNSVYEVIKKYIKTA
jgi:signal transduction histidine kinase/CheY-like chemotaxis protein